MSVVGTSVRRAGGLPAGVQAVVTSVHKWHRLSLWIAEPWAESWGEISQAFLVTDWSSFRAKPMHTVPQEYLASSLANPLPPCARCRAR